MFFRTIGDFENILVQMNFFDKERFEEPGLKAEGGHLEKVLSFGGTPTGDAMWGMNPWGGAQNN